MGEVVIAADDPRAPDVLAILNRHLAFAFDNSPYADVHALDASRLVSPDISFFSARIDGVVLGVGAIRELDSTQGELKSMHTVHEARGRGVGRAMVDHLVAVARTRGYSRVSLETGSTSVFQPAHRLYAAAGFGWCGPFGDYQASDFSVFMTLDLV